MERYDVRLWRRNEGVIQDPPLVRAMLCDVRLAWVWLVARVYLGWQWFDAGRQKIQDPAWMDGGAALQGYWERAVQVPEAGQAQIAYGSYRGLIQIMLDHESYSWLAKLIAVGEVFVGIALILGLFTGIAAFVGSFMNFNFMLAGSAASNPVLFVLAIGVILAWKTAGWIGLDRWVLPLVGTPWRGGSAPSSLDHAPATPVAVTGGQS